MILKSYYVLFSLKFYYMVNIFSIFDSIVKSKSNLKTNYNLFKLDNKRLK